MERRDGAVEFSYVQLVSPNLTWSDIHSLGGTLLDAAVDSTAGYEPGEITLMQDTPVVFVETQVAGIPASMPVAIGSEQARGRKNADARLLVWSGFVVPKKSTKQER